MPFLIQVILITFKLIQLKDILIKRKMKKGNIMLLGAVLSLTGLTACRTNSVEDIDGNVYKTVTVGTQVWMAENLKTTKYNDGTDIPSVTNNDEWAKLTTPAYSWYNNDASANKKDYGALYNWYAVGTNKLCPTGWHVSTDAEWMALALFLDGNSKAGGKLKEKGTKHWRTPNTEATGESGFKAFPGGYRSFQGAFNYFGISGYWWSSTKYNESTSLFWNLRYKYGYVYKFRSEKTTGFSVRCIKE
jgi:uncharacterized protein (TIGR02145 family)